MAAKYILLLLSLECAVTFTYPYYGDGRSYPLVTARRQLSYLPKQNSRVAEYPADYDEAYVPSEHVDFDYYDKYDPYAQLGKGSYIPFYRPTEYVREKIPRKNRERMGYYDYPAQQDMFDEDFDGMYADDSWYDDSGNAEANRAFIRNLILAQMYEEEKNPSRYDPYRYDIGVEDYNGRKYEYGIPTTSLGEKEEVQKYFEENANKDVQELKALARKQGKGDEIKELKTTEKPKNVNEIADTSAKTKAKLSDAENYFNLQKQLILNSRKSNGGQGAGGIRLEKKRMADPMNYFDLEPFDESTTNSIKKLNAIKEQDMTKEMPPTSTTIAEQSTTASSEDLAKVGQKEVVLPRPSSPARKPYTEVSTGPLSPPALYDSVKMLFEKKNDAIIEHHNEAKAQPEKRFATDDPLPAELNELKKKSA